MHISTKRKTKQRYNDFYSTSSFILLLLHSTSSLLYKRLAPKMVLITTAAAQKRGALPMSPTRRALAAALEEAAEAAPVWEAPLEALEATAVTLPDPA
jgi:hypothetical protein